MIFERELINQTTMNDRIDMELPKIKLSRSVAAEGFKNILTLNESQTDSVHVE